MRSDLDAAKEVGSSPTPRPLLTSAEAHKQADRVHVRARSLRALNKQLRLLALVSRRARPHCGEMLRSLLGAQWKTRATRVVRPRARPPPPAPVPSSRASATTSRRTRSRRSATSGALGGFPARDLDADAAPALDTPLDESARGVSRLSFYPSVNNRLMFNN
jgi:hypothetical protein